MVRRRVKGFHKGSEEVGGIEGGYSKDRGLRFEGRGFVKVCIRVYYTSGKPY